MNQTDQEMLFKAIDGMYHDSAIRDRSYFNDFRRRWERVIKRAMDSSESYLSENPDAVYTVQHTFGGFDLTLHFDQLKIGDWYERELKRKSKAIFVPKRLKRSRSGVLTLDSSVCNYEPKASEPLLGEKQKNIICCALPGFPPPLQVVYGNKWVDGRFNPLRQTRLSLYFMNTDYVPAFLGSPLEVCLYLFLMDCCIIKENYSKVKDDELRKFLHIFRPSPMLKIKGLL